MKRSQILNGCHNGVRPGGLGEDHDLRLLNRDRTGNHDIWRSSHSCSVEGFTGKRGRERKFSQPLGQRARPGSGSCYPRWHGMVGGGGGSSLSRKGLLREVGKKKAT